MTWDWNIVWHRLQDYSLETVVTIVIVTVLTWFASRIRPHIKLWLQTHSRLRQEITELQGELSKQNKRIRNALDAVARTNANGQSHGHEGQNLWLRPPVRRPKGYFQFPYGQCIPIWVFANLKGGVAKTTNATNLAAHYAANGEQVLLIDLDYQASATAMALRDSQRSARGHDSRATQLVDGRFAPDWPAPHCDTSF
ncbi:MAG TPA: ParA family protein [Hyphomicrobiales bacterium]|nr:ParA family protein [Hyphomicrobiales bacterium]